MTVVAWRSPEDERYMQEAIRLAEEAAGAGEVPVGAVVVRDGRILGRGRNRREQGKDPLAHAEVEAIREACRAVGDWRLSGCTLYVTLEPCPMCAGAIVSARLDRVVYGAADTDNGAVGSVIHLFEMPFGHRPRVTAGVSEEACSAALSAFFRRLREPEKGENRL